MKMGILSVEYKSMEHTAWV